MTSAVVVGASGGIGRALVRRLAERGGADAIFALSRSEAEGPSPSVPGRIDVTDEESVRAAAERVARGGPVGLILVASGQLHGAGLAPEKALRALDPAAMAHLFAANTIGPALVAKHFVPLMPRAGRSVFAALSARVGSIGDNRLGGWYSYRASKAALNQILRTLAVEVRRTHPEAIVAGLHPGTVRTALSHPFRPDADAPGTFTPDEAAGHLLTVLDGLTPAESGGVFAWDGRPVPP
ncbi:SDR family NAD(P)-dependent oxidoreductase [Methylobacterium sp. J-076]|uniref:SDR family NAD(P)-dependent oxidoreductase n=1 Tax=Methylobacterium sp. J-076 TaxID=2836655 RepID=UPI001FBA9E2B|nr:SDR family NAD(P)-dependent oxidoreductase [Methylobacterium sp. J-076]MCJ2012503.1 SDR family NAD(P)-dependent oxidoreductase [Methylobacterium sp. J-076]